MFLHHCTVCASRTHASTPILKALPLCLQTIEPKEVSNEVLATVHSAAYLHSLHTSSLKVAHVIELPPIRIMPMWLVQRLLLRKLRCHAAGTMLAAGLAVERGWAINLGGGMHHAHANNGVHPLFCVCVSTAASASLFSLCLFLKPRVSLPEPRNRCVSLSLQPSKQMCLSASTALETEPCRGWLAVSPLGMFDLPPFSCYRLDLLEGPSGTNTYLACCIPPCARLGDMVAKGCRRGLVSIQ